ncbi:MAG: hypothetical protein V1906_01190 [Candidatus Woesearchaeota archaeon]
MKKSKALLIILVILFSTISIISISYYFYTTVGIIEYPMIAIVSKSMGIDIGTDMIRFGGINPGGGSTRTFSLSNDYDMNVRVMMSVYGDLKDYVSFSDNNFILKPKEARSIDISVGIPKEMLYGEYKGTMKVVLKREV